MAGYDPLLLGRLLRQLYKGQATATTAALLPMALQLLACKAHFILGLNAKTHEVGFERFTDVSFTPGVWVRVGPMD